MRKFLVFIMLVFISLSFTACDTSDKIYNVRANNIFLSANVNKTYKIKFLEIFITDDWVGRDDKIEVTLLQFSTNPIGTQAEFSNSVVANIAGLGVVNDYFNLTSQQGHFIFNIYIAVESNGIQYSGFKQQLIFYEISGNSFSITNDTAYFNLELNSSEILNVSLASSLWGISYK